jgi:hypothetical protein
MMTKDNKLDQAKVKVRKKTANWHPKRMKNIIPVGVSAGKPHLPCSTMMSLISLLVFDDYLHNIQKSIFVSLAHRI